MKDFGNDTFSGDCFDIVGKVKGLDCNSSNVFVEILRTINHDLSRLCNMLHKKDKAIKDGLQNLNKGSEYDNLYFAAKARSEADWLAGINASQALSIAAGRGVFSLERVQTPTLAMICKRFLENKNFVSNLFWQIRVQTEKSNVPFTLYFR